MKSLSHSYVLSECMKSSQRSIWMIEKCGWKIAILHSHHRCLPVHRNYGEKGCMTKTQGCDLSSDMCKECEDAERRLLPLLPV